MTVQLLVSFPAPHGDPIIAKLALTPRQESILENAAKIAETPLMAKGVTMDLLLESGSTMITTPTPDFVAATKRPRNKV